MSYLGQRVDITCFFHLVYCNYTLTHLIPIKINSILLMNLYIELNDLEVLCVQNVLLVCCPFSVFIL